MDEKEKRELERATERVNAAQDALDEELQARGALMRAAVEAGASVSDVARAAKVTRLVVYRQLNK